MTLNSCEENFLCVRHLCVCLSFKLQNLQCEQAKCSKTKQHKNHVFLSLKSVRSEIFISNIQDDVYRLRVLFLSGFYQLKFKFLLICLFDAKQRLYLYKIPKSNWYISLSLCAHCIRRKTLPIWRVCKVFRTMKNYHHVIISSSGCRIAPGTLAEEIYLRKDFTPPSQNKCSHFKICLL